MNLHLLAHCQNSMPRTQLPQQLAAQLRQPPRRAGPLASLAILACRQLVQQEQWQCETPLPLPTALLWHSLQGAGEETEALLDAQQQPDALLMPFEFLASQPALLGVHLQPWLPQLAHALFLPCSASPQEQPWLQALQLASLWLQQGRYRRVICASLDRTGSICSYRALSLTGDLPDCLPLAHAHWQAQAAEDTLGTVSPAKADAALWQWLEQPGSDSLRQPAVWGTLCWQRPPTSS